MYPVTETVGTAVVSVVRVGTTGAVSVDYGTSDGSALAGADYTAASGTLNWADGEGGAKTFQVPIVDDAEPEGPETLGVTLSGPTGGAVLGALSAATVTIAASDVARPELFAPAPGSVLGGATVTFEWRDNGTPVQQWYFNAGLSMNSSEYANSGWLPATTRAFQVTGLPMDGSAVHVRLWWTDANSLNTVDYRFTAAPPP